METEYQVKTGNRIDSVSKELKSRRDAIDEFKSRYGLDLKPVITRDVKGLKLQYLTNGLLYSLEKRYGVEDDIEYVLKITVKTPDEIYSITNLTNLTGQVISKANEKIDGIITLSGIETAIEQAIQEVGPEYLVDRLDTNNENIPLSLIENYLLSKSITNNPVPQKDAYAQIYIGRV